MRERKNLRIEDIVAIQDRREQTPISLAPLRTIEGTLRTGDYSVQGYEDRICAERKSLVDLVSCVTHQRERFEDCIARMKKIECSAIFVEAEWCDIDLKRYHGSCNPLSVYGSLMSWMGQGINILFTGDRQRAGLLIARYLWVNANRMHREKLT